MEIFSRKMKCSNPFIGIAGNIGVGKTTFTEIVSRKFGWKPYYESVIKNPYLSDLLVILWDLVNKLLL